MLLFCRNLGLIEYQEALHLQEDLLMKRYRGEIEDTLVLLEHPSVFTLGRGGNENNLLVS